MNEQNKIRSLEQTQNHDTVPAKRKGVHWAFPVGIALAGLGSVAAVLLRGCWHRNMSWPVRFEHTGYSYQVCTDCGIKRLFDEKHFKPYGPYGAEVRELIQEVERRRAERMEKARVRNGNAPESGETL